MSQEAGGDALQDIDALVSRSRAPVLLDCFTPGCGPCAALAPVLDELAAEMDGTLVIEKVDVAAHPDVVKRFGIRTVPSLLLFSEGKLAATRAGSASRSQLLTWLSAHGAL